MTQSLHIMFKDGTENWGPIKFHGKTIKTSNELFQVLLDHKPHQLITLTHSGWNYPLSQIEKFRDIDLNSI